MPADVISVLEQEHRQVEDVLTRLRAGGPDAAALLDQAATMLIAHSRGEEDVVYPAIREAAPSCTEQVGHSEDEHQKVEALLTELRRTGPGGSRFTELLEELVASVQEHVQEEETLVLPALRQAADQPTLTRLAQEFEQRRQAEVTTGQEPYPTEMTKAELYERAKQLDIRGRSNMTKDELARAVSAR